jgi:hypothetical protein
VSPQYERVIAALKAAGSRRRGNNWQCKAHDDRVPSLSVNLAADGSGWVLMFCHAGCSLVEITAAIGLTPADLFPGNGHQLALFPKSRYSPIGIDVIRKTPSSAIARSMSPEPSVDMWTGGVAGPMSRTRSRCFAWSLRSSIGKPSGSIWNSVPPDSVTILPNGGNGASPTTAQRACSRSSCVIASPAHSAKRHSLMTPHLQKRQALVTVGIPKRQALVTVLGTNRWQPTPGSLKS